MDWHELALDDRGDRKDRVYRALEAFDVPQRRRVAEPFARLLELPNFLIGADRVVSYLASAASPARAIEALEEAMHNLEEKRGDASALFVDPILRLVIELAGSSGRAARLLASDPALAIELGARFDPSRQEVDFETAVDHLVELAGDDTRRFDFFLRRFRNRQMLRIALREIRDADVRDTAAEIADLAAASFRGAIAHHWPLITARSGKPDPDCALVVIGMGKLGGRELNFSSDVDVIYFYEHDNGGAGGLTMHQLFVKLFERVTATLSRISEHGFVFRVDCDLRPEGKKGPLANSLASAERYYQTFGRTWERAAWIKARPIAGSERLGAQVMEMMRPFVWRKSFDLKAIEEIAAMKEKIDAARRRAALAHGGIRLDLKLGVGGIREIEFYVQAHQLLHGGKIEWLRHQNTLEALQRLVASGLMSARLCERLSDAYLFFRKVEHRVQIVEDQQTHLVPRDPEALAEIARSLRFPSSEALETELLRRMAEVHLHFAGLLVAAKDEQEIPDAIALVIDPELSDEQRIELLAESGSHNPWAALANLDACARPPSSPFHPRSSEEHRMIAPRLVFECWQSPSFDRALKHLPDLIRAASVHTALIEQLRRPEIRRGVCRVLGASDLLARILVTSPALLPHVLVGETATYPAALEAELSSRLDAAGDDIETAMGVLRSVKQEQTLRTAMADMADLIDADTVSERLTFVAGVLIGKALELAMRTMIERFGEPRFSDGRPAEVAVVAGGSAGAREMGYRTDLDLTVLYVGDGETTGGTRSPVSCAEFFTRTVQRLLEFLTMRTSQGDLYPVDMRLRPSGTQGPLVVSLANFETYHRKTAQLWERQALVRARSIAGSPELRKRVDEALDRAVYDPGPVDDARERIHEMRLKMAKDRAARGSRDRPALDLKLGQGGLVEVEFLVQYLLIQHGRDAPEIRSTSTREALERLAKRGILPADQAAELRAAHRFLRRVQNWLRIETDEMIDHVSLDPADLRPLALAVGYVGPEAERHLARDLEAETERIHRHYRAWMAPP
jgi:[glutamine synthetase] adenylyltransferase / [glutamine synthetase]-adenylyl-L-tyrosine phosphorylase